MCPTLPAGSGLALPFALPSLGPFSFAHAGTESRKADLMLEQAHSQGLRGCGCLYDSPRNAPLGLGAVGMGVKVGLEGSTPSVRTAGQLVQAGSLQGQGLSSSSKYPAHTTHSPGNRWFCPC